MPNQKMYYNIWWCKFVFCLLWLCVKWNILYNIDFLRSLNCTSCPFHFFIWSNFWMIFFATCLEIHIMAPIYHMFWVNHYWINMIFLSLEIFHILCFILTIYHNFESYQKLFIDLFIFLYDKLQMFFIGHVHYTPFTFGKWLLRFLIFKNTLSF
jgi:hypothetical protein